MRERKANQAQRFLRPRLRRARSTLRPPTVALRAKKPWRRARTRLLGWKVRFMMTNPQNHKRKEPPARAAFCMAREL